MGCNMSAEDIVFVFLSIGALVIIHDIYRIVNINSDTKHIDNIIKQDREIQSSLEKGATMKIDERKVKCALCKTKCFPFPYNYGNIVVLACRICCATNKPTVTIDQVMKFFEVPKIKRGKATMVYYINDKI